MKKPDNKIPFGLKSGAMVGVSEVEKGLACGCVCPVCHRKLQANKGDLRAHYFSHDPSDEPSACDHAFETSIHLMAKQILSEEGVVVVPELPVKVSQTDANGVVHEEAGLVESCSTKTFEHVELEMWLGGLRPDIIAYQEGVPFLIEIAVTNFSDGAKISLIREKSLAAIEIDLSDMSYTTTKEELRVLVIESVKNKKWLSNPAAIEKKKRLKAVLDEKLRKINEEIYRSRQSATPSSSHGPRLKRPSPSYKQELLPGEAGIRQAKQYDPRWFLCEACRHVFSVPLKDAPYTIDAIPCPECDHAVSTKPC